MLFFLFCIRFVKRQLFVISQWRLTINNCCYTYNDLLPKWQLKQTICYLRTNKTKTSCTQKRHPQSQSSLELIPFTFFICRWDTETTIPRTITNKASTSQTPAAVWKWKFLEASHRPMGAWVFFTPLPPASGGLISRERGPAPLHLTCFLLYLPTWYKCGATSALYWDVQTCCDVWARFCLLYCCVCVVYFI